MRRPRLDVPGIPIHVTHRGNNRAATFAEDGDRSAYLLALRDATARNEVALHAYVLMTNHVHLLVTSSRPRAISRVMQSVGRRYVRGVNARYGRTGTLWEGRFKSCLVDSDAYLLSCLRYIELNPVRAQMVADAADYPWSSVHHHLATRNDPLITPHPGYLALGVDSKARADAYRELLNESIDSTTLDELRRHVAQERAWGSPRFQQMVEAMVGRPVALRGCGRPRTVGDSNDNVL